MKSTVIVHFALFLVVSNIVLMLYMLDMNADLNERISEAVEYNIQAKSNLERSKYILNNQGCMK